MRTYASAGLLLVLVLGLPTSGRGQVAPTSPPPDSVKLALIHDLLASTHAADQAVAAMEAALPAQRAANPQIPAVFWDRFLVQARAHRGELDEMIGAIYARHFSSDELQQLLAFYRTPLGQKLLLTLPAVMQESMVAGQTWGQRIGASVGAQLEAEGVHIKP